MADSEISKSRLSIVVRRRDSFVSLTIIPRHPVVFSMFFHHEKHAKHISNWLSLRQFSCSTTLQAELLLKKWVSRSFSPKTGLKLWFYWCWRAFDPVASQETRPPNLEMSANEVNFHALQLCKRNYYWKKWPSWSFPAQTMILTYPDWVSALYHLDKHVRPTWRWVCMR